MANYLIEVRNKNGDVLGEFTEWKSLKFSDRLNDYGECTFQVPVTSTELVSLTTLRRNEVFIKRDKTIVWAGEQVARHVTLRENSPNLVTITCRTFFEMLAARYTQPYIRFENTDQGEILKRLVVNSQANVDLNPYQLHNYKFAANIDSGPFQQFLAEEDFDLDFVDLYLGVDFPITSGTITLYLREGGVNGTDLASASINVNSIAQNFDWHRFDIDYSLEKDQLYSFCLELDQNPPEDQVVVWGGYENIEYPYGIGGWYEDVDTVPTVVDDDITLSMVLNEKYYTSYNSNLGFTFGSVTTGTNRDREYSNFNIMEAFINMSQVIGGPDFYITPEKEINIVPFRGIDKSAQVVLDWGTNIESVEITEDFTSPGNRGIVVGAGFGGAQVIGEANDANSQATYKVREQRVSEIDVISQDVLDAKAEAVAAKYGRRILSLNIFQLPDTVPSFNTIVPGDIIRIRVNHGIYNINDRLRVYGFDVSVDDNNKESISYLVGLV